MKRYNPRRPVTPEAISFQTAEFYNDIESDLRINNLAARLFCNTFKYIIIYTIFLSRSYDLTS